METKTEYSKSIEMTTREFERRYKGDSIAVAKEIAKGVIDLMSDYDLCRLFDIICTEAEGYESGEIKFEGSITI